MTRPQLAADTTPEIEAMRERLAANDADRERRYRHRLTRATFDLALAGIRQRHPDASPREQFLRRAILLYGRELAARAYPDIDLAKLE